MRRIFSRTRVSSRTSLEVSFVGTFLLVLGGIATAAPELRAPQEAIEGSTRDISAPTDANGSIVARTCSTCPQVLLRLDGATRYYVGGAQVDFATLTKYWREAGYRPLGIFYDRKSLNVARIVVDGQLPR